MKVGLEGLSLRIGLRIDVRKESLDVMSLIIISANE